MRCPFSKESAWDNFRIVVRCGTCPSWVGSIIGFLFLFSSVGEAGRIPPPAPKGSIKEEPSVYEEFDEIKLDLDSSDPAKRKRANDRLKVILGIAGLRSDLWGPDPAKRKRAYDHFLEVGPSVFNNLLYPGEPASEDLRKLYFQLVIAIKEKHGIQPVRSYGMNFLTEVPPVLHIPPVGWMHHFSCGLKVTNPGEKKIRFFHYLNVWPVCLIDSKGHHIAMHGGCDHSVPNDCYSDPLEKGQSCFVDFRGVLFWSEDGKDLTLSLEDNGTYFYNFKGLKPGRYCIWFDCQLAPEAFQTNKMGVLNFFKMPQRPDDTPLWFGKVVPQAVPFEIK